MSSKTPAATSQIHIDTEASSLYLESRLELRHFRKS
jgi:hypothetical protein